MDKISGFPEELLVKILSFLPTKVAVSTSVLSKRWQFLWMSSPKLDYNVTHRSVWDFINKNLPLHRAPVIESLCLAFTRQHIKPEDVKLWVEIAVSRFVRELEISYYSYYDSERIVPSSLFACKWLVILKLKGATLMDVPSMVCFPSLKSLQLNEVAYADEKSLEELLSICPVLEDLDLLLSNANMKKITVSVPSLQKLSLHLPDQQVLEGYEIDTPSLKYLKLEDWNYMEHHSLFKNMPMLMEAYVDILFHDLKSFIGSITYVKHLTICSKDTYGDGFVFSHLEHLKLCVCQRGSSNLLAQLLKDSPNLQVLDISMFECHWDHDYDELNDMVSWTQPSQVPECILSSLQIFNWSGYQGRPQDRDIAVYILKNARQLKKVTILACVPNLDMMEELTLTS